MIARVPALARDSTAQCSAWLGALPGCQLAPSGWLCGVTSAISWWKRAARAASLCWGHSASTPTASIARSTPMPLVSLRRVSTGSSRSKLITSAPCWRAMRRRSSCLSMANTRAAPSNLALAMANWPTGPQPNTATVSPSLTSASSAPK
ncbi:hypothetical protein D9M71_474170 [compost metagenome]